MTGDEKRSGDSAQAALEILQRKRNRDTFVHSDGPQSLTPFQDNPPKATGISTKPVERGPVWVVLGGILLLFAMVALYACSCREVAIGSDVIEAGAVQKWRFVFRSRPHRMRLIQEPRGIYPSATYMEGPIDADGEFHGLILCVFRKGDSVWLRYEHGRRSAGGPGDNQPAENQAGREL